MSTSSNKIAKIKAEAYDLVKDEIGKLSGIKKFLFETLFSRLFDIFTEDCSDNDLAQAINSIEKVNSEYVREDDFLNYDKKKNKVVPKKTKPEKPYIGRINKLD